MLAPCPQQCRGTTERGKAKKTFYIFIKIYYKDSLTSERKRSGEKTNQNLQGRQRQSLTTSHQQTDVQQLSQHQLPWKDYPQFLLLCIKFHDMGYSSGQFGSAVYLLCPLPAPCSLQGCSMWGQSKKQRML